MSSSHASIVGAHLQYMGGRIEATYTGSNKGSHATVWVRSEAERFVAFTYLLVNDILVLFDETSARMESNE